MEIKSIMKDTFDLDANKIRKITLNLDKSNKSNIVRFIKHIGKHKSHISMKELEDAMSVLQIPWGTLVSYPTDKLSSAKMSKWNGGTESNDSLLTHKYIGVTYQGVEDELYTIVDTSNGIYPAYNGQMMRGNFRPYNITVLFAVSKIMELVTQEELHQHYLDHGPQLYKAISNKRAIGETEEEIERFLFSMFIRDLMELKGSKTPWPMYYRELYRLLFERVLKVYDQELNIQLMNSYSKELTGDYARAFQTKKNIPQKVLDAMAESDFLKHGFSFVEYDEDTDLSKVKLISDEWASIKHKLPKSNVKTQLRFRKLGNYRAAGVYFPYINCMAVDLRQISSFVHEYAHHLDYTYSDKVLSVQEDFLPIVQAYRKNFDKMSKEFTPAQSQYYTTPTEIFARGYEVYLVVSGYQTNLVTSKDSMTGKEPYLAILKDKSLVNAIIEYYTKVFGK